jgi:hypothetical protein
MNRLQTTIAVAAALCAGAVGAAQSRADRITIPLSDPGRPVTLDIALTAGIVQVTATDGRDIVIDASGPASTSGRALRRGRTAIARKDTLAGDADTTGLSRLPQPTDLDVEESNNVVRVRGRANTRVDLTIAAPVRTALTLRKTGHGSAPGAVTVRGLDGDLEVHVEAGDITLSDVSGSVIAHSTGGSVLATVKRVTPDRPMAFTSYSGNVDVTLPRSIRADLILRSSLKDVFTDFELLRKPGAPADQGQAGGFRQRGNQGVRATVNGGGPEFELRTYAGNVYLRREN